MKSNLLPALLVCITTIPAHHLQSIENPVPDMEIVAPFVYHTAMPDEKLPRK